VAHVGQCAAHGRAQPRVAQPRGGGGLEVDRAQRERLGELGRAGQHGALVVEHDGVAVEDELVLAADEVAERDRAEVVARPLDEHLLALAALAREVGGRRCVHDQRRAGERLLLRRMAGGPDVLADRQPDPRGAEVDHHRVVARLEVALLVEDAVVGEQGLAVDRRNLAIGEHGERVVDVLRALGEADHGDDLPRVGRDLAHRRLGLQQEVLLEQQVLGRVAGQHELREEDELGARVARAGDLLAHEPHVAVEVADARIDLRQRERQRRQRAGRHQARARAFAGRRARLPRAGPAGTPAALASSAIEASSAPAMSSRSGNTS
jgi:hypothetical protein